MNDYTIASVQRALRILKLFLPDNQPMTLKQIADESELNKSTALRMTTTLLNEISCAATSSPPCGRP